MHTASLRISGGTEADLPHCGSVRKPCFLKPSNGKTRTGSMSERRVWKCADCRKQFSVLTGTIFHGTKIPVRKWSS
jgi:transposase-like protein